MGRTYYGANIYPMDRNSWGGRWESYVNGHFVRAETLAGIKELIRHELGVAK